MPGAEDDSRFAGSFPELAARGLQKDSIEHARLQQLVLTPLSVKKIERKSLKAENAATVQV
jgi:hypothetical protein